MENEASASTKDNPLVRALSRWENEGGSVDAHWRARADAMQEEEDILRYLGAAVIKCWNTLPVEIQRELFVNAASYSEPLHTGQGKEKIARFLHSRKDL